MANQGKLPIAFTFSCLNGYFDSPRFPTIVERFLNEKNKGAIAFASNTRDSTAVENLFLNRYLYESIFNHDINRLCPVLTLSKIKSALDVKQYDTHMNKFVLCVG